MLNAWSSVDITNELRDIAAITDDAVLAERAHALVRKIGAQLFCETARRNPPALLSIHRVLTSGPELCNTAIVFTVPYICAYVQALFATGNRGALADDGWTDTATNARCRFELRDVVQHCIIDSPRAYEDYVLVIDYGGPRGVVRAFVFERRIKFFLISCALDVPRDNRIT